MTQKSVYIWGSINSFTGPLTALLLQKGWHVDVVTKSALNLFTLAPIDLRSAAESLVQRAFGSQESMRTFKDRLRFLEAGEVARGITYDAVVFCGLPPNFDEPRAPRAPWAAGELPAVVKALKGAPVFIVSSLWAAVQPDGAVPEEVEFERRKPKTHWESICQQYEERILDCLSGLESPWHLIRLPLITGSMVDGSILNFSGLTSLLKQASGRARLREGAESAEGQLAVAHNPDSTLWYLPVDSAVQLFWRLMEDGGRPRICNLVSTQATLNREWLDHLARALGLSSACPVDPDSYSLPDILRSMLKDSIHVRTRNLFEVAGRYHFSPAKLDESYFQKLLSFGRREHWGRPFSHAQEDAGSECNQEVVKAYFEESLPALLSEGDLRAICPNAAAVGFVIEVEGELAYSLRPAEGRADIQSGLADSRVKLIFPGASFINIVSNRTPLHRALLTREARIEGPILDTIRVANQMARVFREHPFDPQDNGR